MSIHYSDVLPDIGRACIYGNSTVKTMVTSSFLSGGYGIAVALARQSPAISLADAWLNEMTGLNIDWNEAGAERPNKLALDLAKSILDRTFLMGRREPNSVTASVEGGVGIVFRKDDRYAAIECLNEGTLWLLWYDQDGVPRSRQVANSGDDIDQALEMVTALHGDA